MATGACLCGGVGWRVDEAGFHHMSHCHCSMCRKAHGAAFATYATVARSAFERTGDAALVVERQSSPGFHRAFCRTCGAVVPSLNNGDTVYVPVGGMHDDPGWRASHHIFTAHAAPWHRIADTLPRHALYRPGEAGPVVERPAPVDGDGVAGSCLCGAVAFAVTAPFRVVHNCHCTRCRRARQAAHTTNGFVAIDDFRWRRGAAGVVLYRLPEARVFAHAFCRLCGSGMPRITDAGDTAILPLGALDSDPGRQADDHIFTDFATPWYEGEDGLPRHPGPPPPS